MQLDRQLPKYIDIEGVEGVEDDQDDQLFTDEEEEEIMDEEDCETTEEEEEEEEMEMNDQNTELAAKLQVSRFGICYVCEEIGLEYSSIYLCCECESKMNELVEKAQTVFCRDGCPKNCSSCLLSIVFQYLDVNNIYAYEKIDYNLELMIEYVYGGSEDKVSPFLN
ncbi:uncharacterized protein LOC111613720 [Centruroides sculpturatus]|uniref:uncharacterized protein LOC111613720 n=1 Tax=Centruroides sculpturatus TaxID=218467 RepID=UPI000C6CAEC1|nr:uncharacterized protein LOC111613720 [Centruroides sculpturatus]